MPPSVDVERERAVAQRIATRQVELTPQLIDRFAAVAFGSEYRGGARLVSWNRPITIRLMGSVSSEDEGIVREVIADLDALLLDTEIRLVEREERIQMAFTDRAGFVRNAPDRAHDNAGYFYIRWHPKSHFAQRGKILVRADLPLVLRRHVVREEITQSLGLMRDIDAKDSVLAQSGARLTRYTPLDEAVIRLWEALRPLAGEERATVVRSLERLMRQKGESG